MLLKGKTVYITGGTGGIGTPLVQMMRDAEMIVEAHDYSAEGDLYQNIESLQQKLAQNTPDILINMAGINKFDYAENHDYTSMIHTNLLVPMMLSQAVLPAMKERGNGQIVNISSMVALIPLPHNTGYVASKAGLKGFNDALRRELEGTGIKVTLILPRAVNTSMNQGAQNTLLKKTGVKTDTPDYVAQQIFEAIAKGKKELRLGAPEKIFAALNANIPSIIDMGLASKRKAGEEILKARYT